MSPAAAKLEHGADPFGEPIAHVLRLSEGELEVVAGPFPANDPDAIEEGIISVLVTDGWNDDDGFYISTIGPNWADMDEVAETYLNSLKDDAIDECEDDEDPEEDYDPTKEKIDVPDQEEEDDAKGNH